MAFTQKYTIISPLVPLIEGQIFKSNNWPLHVTLADTFAIHSVQGEFVSLLELAITGYQVTIKGERTAYFGDEHNVEVTLLHPSDELLSLHYSIVELLLDKSATFNDPQFTKSGYIGHVTKQKYASLEVGEVRELETIALIEMFPEGDPYARKVIKIIKIDKN